MTSSLQAARDGLVETVDLHLESNLSGLDAVDEDGYTALHHAARYNRVRTLETLLMHGASECDVSTTATN